MKQPDFLPLQLGVNYRTRSGNRVELSQLNWPQDPKRPIVGYEYKDGSRSPRSYLETGMYSSGGEPHAHDIVGLYGAPEEMSDSEFNFEELSDRELDAMVAEKVMGCKVVHDSDAYMGGPICGCNGNKLGPHDDHVDDREDLRWLIKYSTDIAAAWTVVEKLMARERCFSIVCAAGQYSLLDEVELDLAYSQPSAPRAICLAALKACSQPG